MLITKTSTLTQDIIQDIKRVEQACKEHDRFWGSISWTILNRSTHRKSLCFRIVMAGRSPIHHAVEFNVYSSTKKRPFRRSFVHSASTPGMGNNLVVKVHYTLGRRKC